MGLALKIILSFVFVYIVESADFSKEYEETFGDFISDNILPLKSSIGITHKPRRLRTCGTSSGGKQTPTATYKTQLARLNIWATICEGRGRNLRGLSLVK